VNRSEWVLVTIDEDPERAAVRSIDLLGAGQIASRFSKNNFTEFLQSGY
jgi:hypothetical protein